MDWKGLGQSAREFSERKEKDLLNSYKNAIRKATDQQVLHKLNVTSGEAYEITEMEARRRNLI